MGRRWEGGSPKRRECEKELGGVEGWETIIRIYSLRKNLFSIKKKKYWKIITQ